jgi:hypothetical protein
MTNTKHNRFNQVKTAARQLLRYLGSEDRDSKQLEETLDAWDAMESGFCWDTRELRQLALALLCDDHGIPESAYNVLGPLLDDCGLSVITKYVKATDGRFYLPYCFTGDSQS